MIRPRTIGKLSIHLMVVIIQTKKIYRHLKYLHSSYCYWPIIMPKHKYTIYIYLHMMKYTSLVENNLSIAKFAFYLHFYKAKSLLFIKSLIGSWNQHAECRSFHYLKLWFTFFSIFRFNFYHLERRVVFCFKGDITSKWYYW